MIGLSAYRHDGVKVTNEGAWRREPAAPASSSRQLDGIFGLGGQRVKPAGADARSAVSLLPGAASGSVRWTVVYRADADDRLRVSVRGGDTKTLGANDGKASASGSGLRRASLEGGASSALDIAISGGAPEVFGVFAESKTPGLVLDTLGINGARAATALAWESKAWMAEAKARNPSLVVLAYGTNEAAGAWAAQRYEKSLEALATQVRQVSTEADCVVIGPPDMAGAGGKSTPRVIEHDEVARRVAGRVGCAFFSAFTAMGGEGSFARWAKETPPLAAADHVHLRSGGYTKLGIAVADALVAGYRGPASR
jgi:lysophospholipase L1-like esterase